MSKNLVLNRKHQREWYSRNRAKKIQEVHARRNRLREVLRELKSVPCGDCNQSYPYYVMDFDHVRGRKIGNVATLAQSNPDAAIREAKKCDVVCANCHRLRSNWRRLNPIQKN